MTMTVTQAQNGTTIGGKIGAALEKYAPVAAVKVIATCGNLALIPMKMAKDLTDEVSGVKTTNYVGDAGIKVTMDGAKKVTEATTKLSIFATRRIADYTAGR